MPTVAIPRHISDAASASAAPPIAAAPSARPPFTIRKAALLAGPLVAVILLAVIYSRLAGHRAGAKPSATQAISAPSSTSSSQSVSPAAQAVSPTPSQAPAGSPNEVGTEGAKQAESDAQKVDAEKAAQQAAARRVQESHKRKQALDTNLQQFNSLKNQRQYDGARALLASIGKLGGDTEGLKADLASAASAEFRELQAKRSDADQRKDIKALQNLAKSYEDLARRDSGDPQWSNRTRDIAENQIPEEIRALTPRPSMTTDSSKTGATKAARQPNINLMNVEHTPLTMPFSSSQLYQQNFLDPGFRILSKPELSNLTAPSGTALTLLLEVSPEGLAVKLSRCLVGPAALCQSVANAPGWRFSNPTVKNKSARAMVGLIVRF